MQRAMFPWEKKADIISQLREKKEVIKPKKILPDDVVEWPKEILDYLYDEFPFIRKYKIILKVDKKNPEQKSAIIYAVINVTPDEKVILPIFVVDGGILPSYPAVYNGEFIPMEEKVIKAIETGDTSIGKVVDKTIKEKRKSPWDFMWKFLQYSTLSKTAAEKILKRFTKLSTENADVLLKKNKGLNKTLLKIARAYVGDIEPKSDVITVSTRDDILTIYENGILKQAMPLKKLKIDPMTLVKHRIKSLGLDKEASELPKLESFEERQKKVVHIVKNVRKKKWIPISPETNKVSFDAEDVVIELNGTSYYIPPYNYILRNIGVEKYLIDLDNPGRAVRVLRPETGDMLHERVREGKYQKYDDFVKKAVPLEQTRKDLAENRDKSIEMLLLVDTTGENNDTSLPTLIDANLYVTDSEIIAAGTDGRKVVFTKDVKAAISMPGWSVRPMDYKAIVIDRVEDKPASAIREMLKTAGDTEEPDVLKKGKLAKVVKLGDDKYRLFITKVREEEIDTSLLGKVINKSNKIQEVVGDKTLIEHNLVRNGFSEEAIKELFEQVEAEGSAIYYSGANDKGEEVEVPTPSKALEEISDKIAAVVEQELDLNQLVKMSELRTIDSIFNLFLVTPELVDKFLKNNDLIKEVIRYLLEYYLYKLVGLQSESDKVSLEDIKSLIRALTKIYYEIEKYRVAIVENNEDEY